MEPQKQVQMPDLFGIWRDYFNKQQETLEQVLHQMMKTDEFASLLSKQVDLALARKQMTARFYEQLLQDVPVATQADITRLAEQMVNLDARLDRLEVYLEETVEPAIFGLKAQLDRIEQQLSQLAQPAGRPAPEPRKRRTPRSKGAGENGVTP